MVYLGNTWFTVIGILKPALLDSSIDTTVFISLPVAERLFQTPPNPSEIYVRANVNDVTQVSNLLAPTADPQNASGVQVSRPSDVLEARAAAKGQFTTLLLGLGAVALLVGAIGIANIMVISVLERRGEIGLRRALGATRRHISTQFLAESALLAALGGLAGLALGAGATEVYAVAQKEPFVVPAVRTDRGSRRRTRDRRARRALSGDQGRPAQPDRGAAGLDIPGPGPGPRYRPGPAGSRRPATGDRRPATGDRRPATGDRRPRRVNTRRRPLAECWEIVAIPERICIRLAGGGESGTIGARGARLPAARLSPGASRSCP